jgi:hypothetical protein
MFINAHLRLAIPGVLGPVTQTPAPASLSTGLPVVNGPLFDTTEDPATRVPNIIAFQNDGEVAVTLHFDAGNNKAQIQGTVAATYNIGSTNLNLLIQVDGETPVAIVLSTGGTQTAANICTNINAAFAAAGGNTSLAIAQDKVISGSHYVLITSGTTGVGSQINIQAPATNSANSTLGFVVANNTAYTSFQVDIVSALTINAKAIGTFVNPRPGAAMLQIRGVGAGGVNTVIDATTLYSHNGIQQ